MELSVVAPCYNEEDGLEAFVLRMVTAIRDADLRDYEIVLVDDGSADRTWPEILRLRDYNPRIRGLRLSRNFGHQAALSAGLKEARGKLILIIDADLQDPPELLTSMLERHREGFDVVYGQRRTRSGETRFKLATAAAFYRVLGLLTDIRIPKDTGDFRLINRKVLDAFNSLTESQRFSRGLVSWLGFRQSPLLYDRDPRFAGVTKYPLRKMLNFSLDAITGFSLKPLRLIVMLGLLTSAVSLLAISYVIAKYFAGETVPGWSSLMCVTLLLSGIQLLSLGVVGEYVGRTFAESKRRPLYLIQEGTGDEFDDVPEIPAILRANLPETRELYH